MKISYDIQFGNEMVDNEIDYVLDHTNDIIKRAKKVNKGFRLMRPKITVGLSQNDFMMNRKTFRFDFTAYKAPRIAFRR